MNIENAVKNLDYICDTKQIKSILFNLTYNDMDCRIIYAKQSKVILIAIREKNVAWFVPIESGVRISTFVPREVFFEIKEHLDDNSNDKSKKTTLYFFQSIVTDMEIIDKEQASDANNINGDELNQILKGTVTRDKKYDKKNGLKPYFDTWVRNSNKNVSWDNLLKTKRIFGEDVALICKENNISSRWSKEPTEKSTHIFNYSKTLENLDDVIE